jgi:hypothetical protein
VKQGPIAVADRKSSNSIMQRASSTPDDDYIPDTSNQKLGFLAK